MCDESSLFKPSSAIGQIVFEENQYDHDLLIGKPVTLNINQYTDVPGVVHQFNNLSWKC